MYRQTFIVSPKIIKNVGGNIMKLDIVGDVHGCFDEFKSLTEKLGYDWNEDIPIHQDNRKIVFVGDITDRGPKSIQMIKTVSNLVKRKLAYYTPGNHCNKLYRYFIGNKVQIAHGLETTVAEYESLSDDNKEKVKNTFIRLYEQAPLYLILDHGRLIVAHAGIRKDDIGRYDKKVKTFVLYGDITGEKHEDGRPVRRDWAKLYNGEAIIVYGHTPVDNVRVINHTYNIDTGAVFGGKLTALRYPEMEIVDVPSSMPYLEEKFTKFN